MKKLFFYGYFIFLYFSVHSQSNIGNYVSNGSFEVLNSNSVTTQWNIASYWTPIDSNGQYCYSGYLLTILSPISNAPYFQGFQYARSGNNYCAGTFYCPSCGPYTRVYPFNRLKRNLIANKTYCATFYVVNANISAFGIDSYGMYFANSSFDTVTTCSGHLTYLTPQIKNPVGNIVTDTLHWTAISGTFVANGDEKYLVLGNFNTEVSTNTLVINTNTNAIVGTDVCIDDVSVIEMNLPAYAGRDTTVLPGSPVFLGREPDFATDSGCVWYQWPNLTSPIDTISGFWVNPVVTTTYIVKQVLDCSPEKWDTVVVRVDATVGNSEFKMKNEGLLLFPNPADGYLELSFESATEKQNWRLRIYSSLGELLREEEFAERINTEILPAGVYILQLSGPKGIIRKSFLVGR